MGGLKFDLQGRGVFGLHPLFAVVLNFPTITTTTELAGPRGVAIRAFAWRGAATTTVVLARINQALSNGLVVMPGDSVSEVFFLENT